MCELLGMSANVPTDICFSFTGLVQRGGGTGPHKDGWGITFYEGKGCRTFKDPQPSFNSPIAKLVQDYPIKSCSVVAHRVEFYSKMPDAQAYGVISIL